MGGGAGGRVEQRLDFIGCLRRERADSREAGPEVGGGGSGGGVDTALAAHAADLGQDAAGAVGVFAEAVAPPAAKVRQLAFRALRAVAGELLTDVRQKVFFGPRFAFAP